MAILMSITYRILKGMQWHKKNEKYIWLQSQTNLDVHSMLWHYYLLVSIHYVLDKTGNCMAVSQCKLFSYCITWLYHTNCANFTQNSVTKFWGAYLVKRKENGKFCVTVGPFIRTADIMDQSVKGNGYKWNHIFVWMTESASTCKKSCFTLLRSLLMQNWLNRE